MIHEKDIRQIYILGDIHFGIKGNSFVWSEIQEKFLLETFPRQLRENGHSPKDSILILEGDIFHSRQSIDVRIFNMALDIFAKLADMFRSVYVILGNHDVYYKEDNSVNSVQIFGKLLKNVWVFSEPQKLCVNDDHTFLLLPWVESVKEITEIVEKNATRCQYIVCHTDIQNASMNSFTKIEKGKGIDLHALSTYKRIYSGHIHLRQEIKKYGASVSYTGTPYSMDKNDVGNQKGFDILSFADGQLVEKFVPNTDSPVFVRKNLYTVLEMNTQEICDMIRNNFVEIQVDTRIANRFSVQVFMEMIKDMGHKKIEFTNYTPKDKMDAKEIVRTAEGNGIDLSIPVMFGLYLDQKGYDRGMRQRVEAKFNVFLTKVKDQQTKD